MLAASEGDPSMNGKSDERHMKPVILQNVHHHSLRRIEAPT